MLSKCRMQKFSQNKAWLTNMVVFKTRMGSQKEKQSEFVANGEIKQFVISKTHNCASKLEDGAYES